MRFFSNRQEVVKWSKLGVSSEAPIKRFVNHPQVCLLLNSAFKQTSNTLTKHNNGSVTWASNHKDEPTFQLWIWKSKQG